MTIKSFFNSLYYVIKVIIKVLLMCFRPVFLLPYLFWEFWIYVPYLKYVKGYKVTRYRTKSGYGFGKLLITDPKKKKKSWLEGN